MLKKLVCSFFVLQLIMVPVYAKSNNPLRKAARGVVNLTMGAVEIPRQMIKVNEEDGDIAGATWGLLKGIACGIGRTALGAYEVTTFLIPPYRELVQPEFIIEEED